MIALSLAEQMAIPQGKMLTDIEMRDLVNRWLRTYTSRHLPNGQTIVTLLTHEEIQKRF
jgi:DNA mismatch repair ATPase MutL